MGKSIEQLYTEFNNYRGIIDNTFRVEGKHTKNTKQLEEKCMHIRNEIHKKVKSMYADLKTFNKR